MKISNITINSKKTQSQAQIVAEWTGIPVTHLRKRMQIDWLTENVLHKRVIGQDEAVTAVAKAVRRARRD